MNHAFAVATLTAFAFAAAPTLAADAPRDPFAPYTVEVTDTVIGGEKRCAESIVACVDLDAVTLKAVVTGTATPRAMVENKTGRSVTLRVGDLVGKGRITAITRSGVMVERMYFDAMGRALRSNVLLTLT